MREVSIQIDANAQANPNTSHTQTNPNSSRTQERAGPISVPGPLPRSPGSTTSSTEQQITSQRLWERAYDSVVSESDSETLAKAYIKTLTAVLATDTIAGADATTDNSTERQEYMRKLTQDGQVKIVAAVESVIDLAIKNTSQAALPWAGVCVGLQVST